jgi:hypothetical protein
LFQRTVAADTGLPPSVSTTPLKEAQIPGAATMSNAAQTWRRNLRFGFRSRIGPPHLKLYVVLNDRATATLSSLTMEMVRMSDNACETGIPETTQNSPFWDASFR